MRKQLTEEQKRKAEERRERFKTLCKRLAGMSDAERATLTSQVGAVLSCEGRALSLTNTLLLMLQHRGVSVVGGFRQWKKAGRHVRKGESGLAIWIPRGGSPGVPALEGAEVSQRELVEAGEGEEGGRMRFLVGTVFDISSTSPLSGAEGAALDVEAVEVGGEGESSSPFVSGAVAGFLALEGGRE